MLHRIDETEAMTLRMRCWLAGAVAALRPVLLVIVAIGIPACAEAQDASRSESVGGMSAEQRAAVADGQVTEAEYEAGYRRFSTCMSASAVPLRETGRRGSLRTFLIPDDAVTAGIDERCYRRHFAQIDGLYQGAHERESETYLTLAACVRAIGDGPEPNDTSADLVDRLEHAGSSQEACFQRASGGMAAP